MEKRKRVSPTYNLLTEEPELAAQWNYEKNGKLLPDMVSPYSGSDVWWTCPFDHTHVWRSRVSNRSLLLRDCPICGRRFRISYVARALLYYLRKCDPNWRCEEPFHRYTLDLILPEAKLVVEHDGWYHHTDLRAIRRDRAKDEALWQEGYRIIRMRDSKELKGAPVFERDTLTYQWSEQKKTMDEAIKKLIWVLFEREMDIDHKRDHWEIERSYYHTMKARSLAVRYPELAAEWSGKNPVRPDAVSCGQGDKVWWKCSKCGREYEATVANRVNRGSGCPYCRNLRVTEENSLLARFPKLVQEWDWEKNFPLTPETVVAGTDRKVWWKCEKGHSWSASVCGRTGPRGHGCPYCSHRFAAPEDSLAVRVPALAVLWDAAANGMGAEKVAWQSNRPAWWRCPKGHTWHQAPNQLVKIAPTRYCPYCTGRRVDRDNCLAAERPDLAEEWCWEKNGELTPYDVRPGSNRKVWWQCAKGHQWQAMINSRVRGSGCPYEASKKVCAENSLLAVAPEIAAQWHPTRNGELTPDQVVWGSQKKVWWQCGKGHEWEMTVEKRTKRGQGCPYCSGRRVSPETSLAALRPDLVLQWDVEKTPR